MDAKLSKLRLFVDSLEREEINEEEQALYTDCIKFISF